MGRAYIRVSPEILIDLLHGPVYKQLPDGSFKRLTCSLPPDAKAIRAWPAHPFNIGPEGDICCSFDSDSITNTPGEMMQEFGVECRVERGFVMVPGDEWPVKT